MSIALISIFGTEIKVVRQPRQHERQFTGYAGAHGLTAMDMGTRGYGVVVTGTIRAATRALCQAAMDALETYCINAGAVDYVFYDTNFPSVVFDRPELLAEDGKAFHWTGSSVFVRFVCRGRGLV